MKASFLIFLFTSSIYLIPNNSNSPGIPKSGPSGKSSKKKPGVEISFFLVNSQGEKSTIFSAGENFSFSLAMENLSDDSLFLDNSFLSDGNGFCAVFTHDNQLVGQPFIYGGSQIVSSNTFPFYGSQKIYKLSVPWKDSRVSWTALHHTFRGINQEGLPAGKYYTVFKHRFCFDRSSNRPSLCMQPLNIRVDFEVK